MNRVLSLIGTRPEIIKMSPLLPRFDTIFEHTIVHSGQHYSENLDGRFFNELALRKPDYNLGIGSGTSCGQLSGMITSLEQLIESIKPDAVVVQGDTNTALAGALAAKKSGKEDSILVHVEAGARSFLFNQPEEINRRLIDQIADILFAPYERDKDNLLREGIGEDRIYVVGNTIVDSCVRTAGLLNGYSYADLFGFSKGGFVLATFHRQENVDKKETLQGIVNAINKIGGVIPVIIPIHPRTKKMMYRFNIEFSPKSVYPIEPVGYRDFISLVMDSRFCLTDSGGMQEECGVLGKPAVVMRENTEHVRYVESELHVLTGPDPERIGYESGELLKDEVLYERQSRKKDIIGNATEKILSYMESWLHDKDKQ